MKTALLLVTDLEYLTPTQVLLHSIKLNSPDFLNNVDVIIYSDTDLVPDSIVRTIDVQKYNKTAYREPVFKMMSMLILAIEELKDKYDRIIYLDGDCLVTQDISELLEFPLDGNGLAACPEWNYPGIMKKAIEDKRVFGREHFSRPLLRDPEMYINSGVLIIDCKEIRPDLWKRYLSSVHEYVFPDQDFLYMEYLGRTKRLPYTYNARGEGYLRNLFDKEMMDERRSAVSNSKIIHYIASCKPWHPWVNRISNMTRQVPYKKWIDVVLSMTDLSEPWIKTRVKDVVIPTIPKDCLETIEGFTLDVDAISLKFKNIK